MGLLAVSIAAVLLAQGIACIRLHRNYESDNYNRYDDHDIARHNRQDFEVLQGFDKDRVSVYDLLSGNKRISKYNGSPKQKTLILYGESLNPYSYYYKNGRSYNIRGHSRSDDRLNRNSELGSYSHLADGNQYYRNRDYVVDRPLYGDSEEYDNDFADENNYLGRERVDIERNSRKRNSALQNAVDAALLARKSNEELARAVHAANIARSSSDAKKTLRNAALRSALKAAVLAQQSNAKLATAVRSRGLASRSGGDANEAKDKASIKVALDETRSAKNDNAQLTRALDSTASDAQDSEAAAISHAVQAARRAHESNAEIGEALRSVDETRSGSNAESPAANDNALAAAVKAARLSEQSKNELEAASNAAGNAAEDKRDNSSKLEEKVLLETFVQSLPKVESDSN